LTNDKVQDIIEASERRDNLSEHNDNDNTDVEEVLTNMVRISAGGPGQNNVTKNPETRERIINAPPALESTEVNTSANVLSAPQSSPTYDRAYFRNKALDEYPNLYREFSSEDFDYYGITDNY